jgi:hypothetical protein
VLLLLGLDVDAENPVLRQVRIPKPKPTTPAHDR